MDDLCFVQEFFLMLKLVPVLQTMLVELIVR